MGKLDNTKPFYKQFRDGIIKDIKLSHRIEHSGLNVLLADVAKYCFMGEPCLPPKQTRPVLAELVQPEHALVNVQIWGRNVLDLHKWPSWLN
jgi:hypothetical protein